MCIIAYNYYIHVYSAFNRRVPLCQVQKFRVLVGMWKVFLFVFLFDVLLFATSDISLQIVTDRVIKRG